MPLTEDSFQEFIDAIQTADGEQAFQRIAARVTQQFGFRWFAYLRLIDDAPLLMSSYPKSWTGRYFDLHYQKIDPVVQRARRDNDVFGWNGEPKATGTREQRRFFDEAVTFGIKSGLTVPIRAGFGKLAAFTLATDDRTSHLDRLSEDDLQLVGMYFHTHLTARLKAQPESSVAEPVLTQRERQCLAWTARGKSVADIAILIGISRRTIVFHLENARRKFGAATITQCVAQALRHGLLP
jgi:LuxR family transcriptional activator of conjugal transfer of Ti plasmids